jgi:diguanylate cyclase (GGDEF)-like protein
MARITSQSVRKGEVMELRFYLNILLRKWWIVIPAFLVTLTAGVVFTYSQPSVYRATATYVVVPSSSFGDARGFANGLDLVSRQAAIAATFADIVSSRKIRESALDSLSLESGGGYVVTGKPRRSTNIIEIVVDGADPTVARDLANAVGAAAEEYVQGLYEVFILIPLDEASTPRTPISPKTTNNLILAALLGLVLGGGLAFLAENLEARPELASNLNIIDRETGLYNKEYFSRRLSEEMVRAKRNRYPLSLALMQVKNLSSLNGSDSGKAHSELLRKTALLTTEYLREEDLIAFLGNDTFAMVLPDVTGENAKTLMEYLQTRMALTPLESSYNVKVIPKSIVGITAYNHNGVGRDYLVSQASRALVLSLLSL